VGFFNEHGALFFHLIFQIYFPKEGRKIKPPPLFSDPEVLAEVLQKGGDRYVYVLDRNCVQVRLASFSKPQSNKKQKHLSPAHTYFIYVGEYQMFVAMSTYAIYFVFRLAFFSKATVFANLKDTHVMIMGLLFKYCVSLKNGICNKPQPGQHIELQT
jgi:hypothetical protein